MDIRRHHHHHHDGSVFAQRMQQLYLDVRKLNESLPDSLEVLSKQVLANNSFLKKSKNGKRVLWKRALEDGMRKNKFNAWLKQASTEQRERVEEMKGNWIFQEPPPNRCFSRKTWLVAMRFRYGLDVGPVFRPRKASSVCVSQKCGGGGRDSVKNVGCCAKTLDSKGRHAVTCNVGGKIIHRHDSIVSRLGDLLKRFVISVSQEVFVHELEQVCPETGSWTEAKLDLDVATRQGRFLLDVSVFHPFQKGTKEKFKHVHLSEREQKKYERYPLYRDGQRVTDAALVPIILNTYGGVGTKAVEFLYAVAGNEAKRIIDEISMLAVLLSAEMILLSHAPSNLPNLFPAKQGVEPAAEALPPLAASAQSADELERGKDENGFLRPDLRGEIQGAKVQCLGCSTESKQIFRTAPLSNWNLHCQRMHTKAAATPLESQAAQQDSQQNTQPDTQSPEKRKPARRSAKMSVPHQAENGQPARPAQPPRQHALQRDLTCDARDNTCTIVAKRRAPAKKAQAQTQRAQPAKLVRQHAAQRDVTHDAGSDISASRIVGKGGASLSQASADSSKSLQDAPKKQGSFGSRNVSDMPSRNPVSKESQANLQTNLEPLFSNPAAAKKSVNANKTFSSKSTVKGT